MGVLAAPSAATAAAATASTPLRAAALAAEVERALSTPSAATVSPYATKAAAAVTIVFYHSAAREVTLGHLQARAAAAAGAASPCTRAAPSPAPPQRVPCSALVAAAASMNTSVYCAAAAAATPTSAAAPAAAAGSCGLAGAAPARLLYLHFSAAAAPARCSLPGAVASRATGAPLRSYFSRCAVSSFAASAAGARGEDGGGAPESFFSVTPFRLLARQTNVPPSVQQQLSAARLSCSFSGSSRFFSSEVVQRAVRELPWGSRQDLLRDRVAPVYVQEKRGTTPRREYNVNLLDGIRVRPTVNPYVKLNKAKRYVIDNWPSRDWEDWNPYRCYVRGSRKRYNIPQDLFPYKDELGEWHPPRLSARYKADVKKQYLINGLPWVWEKDFYEGKLHFADRELLGPKRWYRRAFRRERVKEALRKMDDLVLDYRQEVRERKKYNWFEKVVHDFAGEEMATQFIRKRREPKF